MLVKPLLELPTRLWHNVTMRNIAITVDSRANYTRAATVIEAIDQHSDLNCQFIACSKFAHEWRCFTDRSPDNVLDTYEPFDTPISMAKSASRLINSLAECWRVKKPDIAIALTDRYETLAVAITAALLNIRVAHIQGGEITGSVDESLRHCVTKLSQIHFPATQEAAQRIIGMGENPDVVFNVGCPATDLLLRVDISTNEAVEPYVLVLYHPVTTEHNESYSQMKQVLEGVKAAWDGLVVVIGPNHDAGNYGVWQAIKEAGVRAPHSVPHDQFVNLMAHAEVMVGNSSAGIREACYFGTPVLDIGTRQLGREPRGDNVLTQLSNHYSGANKDIGWLMKRIIRVGRFEHEHLYGDGTAGQQIADILATMELPSLQKRFHD